MPPKLVRLCARVDEVTKSSFVLCLAVALTVSFAHSAAAERLRLRNTTDIKWSRIFLTATLPQGTVGTLYNGALGVRGGTAPYTFTETGTLPPGVAMNASTGIFSGTPKTSGTFNFNAVVTDSTGKRADRQLSISVASGTSSTGSQVSVQVSPGTATLSSGGTQQFTASVSGTTNTSVVWSATGGTISSTGLFTAGTTTSTISATIKATSAALPTSTASAIVTINPATSTRITVSVNPTSATVPSGASQQFAAAVSGTSNTAVVWSATAGNISSNGLWTAPAVSTTTAATVTAKSAVADARSSATVNVSPSPTTAQVVSVSIAPGSASVQPQGSVQFAATVSGSSNTAVTWRAGFGTISSTGLYTAPASGTDTVIATSQADPTKSSSATVSVQSPSSPSGPSTGGGNGGTPNPAANAYCTASGTWSGAASDGPANLPQRCMYTTVSGTPSPGTVRGPDSSTTALQNDINAAACGDTILVAAGSSIGTITLPAKGCDNAHWITIQSTGVSNSNFPAEGVRMTPCWSGIASMPGRPAYPCSNPQVLTFKLVESGSSSALSVKGDHYRIIGAEITRVSTPGVPVYNLVDLSSSGTQTNNIIFDRVWFHGVPGKFPSTSTSTDTSTTRAIYLGQSNHIAVIDSYLSDFYDTSSMSANGNTDAQCMAGGFGGITNSGWGVYKFVNNHCEASGEGILIGGSSGPQLTPSGCTIMVNCNLDVPTDLEVRQNYFFKPPQWNGNTTAVATTGWPVVKNGFEMKMGARALFEGNVIESIWYSAQGGACWVIAPKNQSNGANPGGLGTAPTALTNDFTYRYNYCYNNGYGIGVFAAMDIGCNNCQSQGANGISIHDNVIGDDMNLGSLSATSTGDAIEILATNDSTGRGLNKLQNVDISHNTIVKAIRSTFLFGGPNDNTRIVNFTIQNNLLPYGNYGWVGVGNSGGCDQQAAGSFYNALNDCVTNWTVDHNALFNWNGGTPGANWPTNGSGTGNFFYTGTASLGATNFGSGNSNFNPGNYALTSSSPLHNAASDGTDIGADTSTLLSVISGVRQ